MDIAKHIDRSAKYTLMQIIYKALSSTNHATYNINVSHIYHCVAGYVKIISHDIFSQETVIP